MQNQNGDNVDVHSLKCVCARVHARVHACVVCAAIYQVLLWRQDCKKKALGLKSTSATQHCEESLPQSGFTVANLSARTLPGARTHTHSHTHTGLFQNQPIDSTGIPAANNSETCHVNKQLFILLVVFVVIYSVDVNA